MAPFAPASKAQRIRLILEENLASYSYDGMGRRTEKIDQVNASTLRYSYNNNHQVLAEYDSSYDNASAKQRYCVYGNLLLKIDEALLMHSYVTVGGNGMIVQHAKNRRCQYHGR